MNIASAPVPPAIIMFVVPCSLKSSLRSQPRLAIRWFRSTPRRAEQFLDANEEVHITTVRVDFYRVFFFTRSFGSSDVQEGRIEYGLERKIGPRRFLR